MGYTHYWESYAEQLPGEAVALIREVLDQAYTDKIVQRECDDPRPPVVTNTEIRFNGRGEDGGHETFLFRVQDIDRIDRGTPFACCQTARRPYDQVVMQVLIVLAFYLRDRITITSDGDFDKEWWNTRRVMEEKYNLRTLADEHLVAA